MEGFTMSHKKSAHRIAIEEEHHLNPGAENVNPAKPTGAPAPAWYEKEEVSVPPWAPIFVLCAIGFGLLVLAAKAIGLL